MSGTRACHTTARMCQCTHRPFAHTTRSTLFRPSEHSAATPGRSPQPGSASPLQPLSLLRSRPLAAPPARSAAPPLPARATTTAPLTRRNPQGPHTIQPLKTSGMALCCPGCGARGAPARGPLPSRRPSRFSHSTHRRRPVNIAPLEFGAKHPLRLGVRQSVSHFAQSGGGRRRGPARGGGSALAPAAGPRALGSVLAL